MAFNNSANNVSSPVSLSKVTQVFDGSSSGSQRNYLRGSLPYPVTNAYSSIAASGTLTLNSFATANNPPAITKSAIFVSDTAFFSGSAATQVTFSSAGNIYEYVGGNLVRTTRWLYGGHQADYDVRFTQTLLSLDTGATKSGTVNTWLNLASSKTWWLNQPSGGFNFSSWVGHIDIRMNASPQTIISNGSISQSCTTEL
jgi:hypothetical protein